MNLLELMNYREDDGNLNESQLKAANHKEGPALCLAAAGSGKTTVITHRVKKLLNSGVSPDRICCLTFSARAQKDMQERLRKTRCSGVKAKTFHSLGLGMINWAADKSIMPFGYGEDFPKYGDQRLIKSSEQAILIENILTKYDNNLDLSGALSIISKCKTNLILPDESFEFIESMSNHARIFSEIYRKYELEKFSKNKIDFDDMLMIPVYLLQNNDFFRSNMKSSYDYIIVDECQDNNSIQSLFMEIMAEDHENIFIVGDDFQSIFGFRGSSPEYSIYNFQEKYPSSSIYLLEQNYRSQENIINISNNLSDKMHNPYNKKLVPTIPGKSDVSIIGYQSAIEEADAIMDEIIDYRLSSGCDWKDFAILYRNNSMSCAIEDALVRESFPYVIYGSRGFYNRKEVKDIVNILKSSVDPVKYQKSLIDSINIASNDFKTPTRFLAKKFINMINDYAEQERISFFSAINKGDYRYPYFKSYQEKGVEDLILFLNRIKAIDDFVEKIKYIKDNSYARYMRRNIDTDLDNPSDDRLACIDELIRSAYNFRDVHSFIEHTERAQELSSQKEDDKNFDGIRCMTIHKSKGLEFDTVFSIGLQEYSLPSYYALEDGDISEERRLAYVAFTRAKKNLHVSYAGEPSRFLYESGLLKLKCASEAQK